MKYSDMAPEEAAALKKRYHEWYLKRKERHKELGYAWKAANRERFLELSRRTYLRRSRKIKDLGIKRTEDQKKRQCEATARWRSRHPEKEKLSNQNGNKKKAETGYQLQWRKKNAERLAARHNERMKNDPIYRIKRKCRSRIYFAIKRAHAGKITNCRELVGCEWEQLKSHLESQFTEGMSWENHGTFWHVDHIMPLAAFDMNSLEGQSQAMHFTNLQPLHWRENLSKGAKIIGADISARSAGKTALRRAA